LIKITSCISRLTGENN